MTSHPLGKGTDILINGDDCLHNDCSSGVLWNSLSLARFAAAALDKYALGYTQHVVGHAHLPHSVVSAAAARQTSSIPNAVLPKWPWGFKPGAIVLNNHSPSRGVGKRCDALLLMLTSACFTEVVAM
jgi:hypothetical protein